MAKGLLDSNLLVRFLINDDPHKAAQVEKLLLNPKIEKILLDMVLAEVVWVLTSVYDFEKEVVIEKLKSLIHVEEISCNRDLLERSLTIWENYNISFVDAYLAANAEDQEIPLYSYDQALSKVVKRLEP